MIKRVYYSNNISCFLKDSTEQIIGELTMESVSVEEQQKNAWGKTNHDAQKGICRIKKWSYYF